MMKKEILRRSTRKVRFFDLKIDLSPFLLKISLKIYRWARLKLRVRKDCGEKLGAVGALYKLEQRGLYKLEQRGFSVNVDL